MTNLQSLNTFGIYASADRLIEVSSLDQLQNLCQSEELKSTDFLILGGGSNILFKADFHGLVLLNLLKGITILKEDEESIWIEAKGGEVWHNFVLYCVEKGWGGLENLALIPGTIGAAPIQNIGAYGVEISSVIETVLAVELKTGKLQSFDNNSCHFGYRESIFKKEAKGRFFIVSVVFKLSKLPKINTSYGDIISTLNKNSITEPTIKDVCNAVIEIRSSKLPNPKVIGNAGSFFKNPVIAKQHFEQLKLAFPDIRSFPVDDISVKVPAAWLIEQTGWKGKRLGNVGVHDKQALVLVNYGNGTGNELLQLAYKIIDSVKNKFNIELTPEVNII